MQACIELQIEIPSIEERIRVLGTARPEHIEGARLQSVTTTTSSPPNHYITTASQPCPVSEHQSHLSVPHHGRRESESEHIGPDPQWNPPDSRSRTHQTRAPDSVSKAEPGLFPESREVDGLFAAGVGQGHGTLQSCATLVVDEASVGELGAMRREERWGWIWERGWHSSLA
jgi:hypothetical protein